MAFNAPRTVGEATSNITDYDVQIHGHIEQCATRVIDYINGGSNCIIAVNLNIGRTFTELINELFTEKLKPEYTSIYNSWADLSKTLSDFSQYMNLVRAANDNICATLTGVGQRHNITFDDCGRVDVNTGSFDWNLLNKEQMSFHVEQGRQKLEDLHSEFKRIFEIWDGGIANELHDIMSMFQQIENETIVNSIISYGNEIRSVLANIDTSISKIVNHISSYATQTAANISTDAQSVDVKPTYDYGTNHNNY